jgi:hypothetical protein
MWVVWIVLKLLFYLVVDKIGSARSITTIQKIDNNSKKSLILPNDESSDEL